MAAVMKPRDANPKTKPRMEPRAVSIVRIIGGPVGRVAVLNVNPCLSRPTSHLAVCLLLGRSPSQPNCIRRHARPNLSLPHQGLVPRRKRIEHIGMLGNSVSERFATC